MGKYLLQANYTQSGLAGLLKEGGTRRRAALTETIEGVGGRKSDLFITADLPDDTTAAAVSLAIGSRRRGSTTRSARAISSSPPTFRTTRPPPPSPSPLARPARSMSA